MTNLTDNAHSLLKKHIDIVFAKEFAYTSHFNLEQMVGDGHPLAEGLWEKYEELADMAQKSADELLRIICIGLENDDND